MVWFKTPQTASGVIIDLSPAAFEVLAGLELGHAEVTVEVVDKPPAAPPFRG